MAVYQFIQCSGNSKTGPMPTTASRAATCPRTCGLWYACYAKAGHCGMNWRKLNQADKPQTASQVDTKGLLQAIKRLRPHTLWRHNVMGDLDGKGNVIDGQALARLAKANRGREGYTYTHKPVLQGRHTVKGKPGQQHVSRPSKATVEHNRAAVKAANTAGFTVNLSADSLEQADAKADLDIGPVVVVLPESAKAGGTIKTPKGRLVKICPAALTKNKSKNVSCYRCALCQKVDRKVIMGFPVHGALKKRIKLDKI